MKSSGKKLESLCARSKRNAVEYDPDRKVSFLPYPTILSQTEV
jgi:hypothetical protein